MMQKIKQDFKLFRARRAQLSFSPNLAITIVLFVVTLALAPFILAKLKTGFGSGTTTALNSALDNGVSLFSNFASLLPVIGTILGVGLIIGVLYFAFRQSQ